MLWDCHFEDLGYEGPWFMWEQENFAHNNFREMLDRDIENSE